MSVTELERALIVHLLHALIFQSPKRNAPGRLVTRKVSNPHVLGTARRLGFLTSMTSKRAASAPDYWSGRAKYVTPPFIAGRSDETKPANKYEPTPADVRLADLETIPDLRPLQTAGDERIAELRHADPVVCNVPVQRLPPAEAINVRQSSYKAAAGLHSLRRKARQAAELKNW